MVMCCRYWLLRGEAITALGGPGRPVQAAAQTCTLGENARLSTVFRRVTNAAAQLRSLFMPAHTLGSARRRTSCLRSDHGAGAANFSRSQIGRSMQHHASIGQDSHYWRGEREPRRPALPDNVLSPPKTAMI